MATSSITRNFTISGKKQIEMFINAVEESAKDDLLFSSTAAREIKGEAELREFMMFREMKAKEKINANGG